MTMKSIIVYCAFEVLLLTVFPAVLSADPSFTGKAGIKAETASNPESNYYDPTMTLQSFFAGQFDFSRDLTVRTEFSLQTEDIIDSGIFDNTDATFKIDELSLTKQFLVGGFLNYFSLFAGSYEPIGSDIFLRRHFGIEPVDSLLTQSWLGLKGSSIHPFYGVGGSLITRLYSQPVATGAYIYVNHENTDNYELNTDIRIACAYDNFCLDFATGIGAPLNSENADGEEAFLVIDEVYLHTGAEMMIGNRYNGGLFAEGGFQNMRLTRGADEVSCSADDVYLLIEPRFVSGSLKCNLSLFSFPEETVDDLFFINDPLGIDIVVFSDTVKYRNIPITIGVHATVSFPGKNITDWESVLNNEYDTGEEPNAKISPFITIPIAAGNLQTMLQVIASDLNDTPEQAFVFDIGYRSAL